MGERGLIRYHLMDMDLGYNNNNSDNDKK